MNGMEKSQRIGERIFARFKGERGRELSIVAWYIIVEQFYGAPARQYNRLLLDVAELGDALQS